MKGKKTIFLTGATGLLGSYLLKILLENGHKVYVLARKQKDKNAKQRVVDILKFWDHEVLKNSDKLVILEGDITKQDLDLNKKTIKLLQDEIGEVFHCAAITEFNRTLDSIRKTNVDGTRRILNLASRCKGLKKVNHISTAYVCGDHKGVFKEDDLDVGQKFNITYEQTKFEAEKVVEEFRKKDLWIDIFRPAFVLGESNTGKTPLFQNLFQAIHLWSLEIFDSFPAKDVSFNIINIDTLSKSIFILNSHVRSKNMNYHPFGSQSISLEKIIDIASEFVGFKKPQLVNFDELNKNKLTAAQKRLLQNNIFSFNPYVALDSTKTNRILQKYGFNFPVVTKKMILNLLEYAIDVNYIKHGKHSKK